MEVKRIKISNCQEEFIEKRKMNIDKLYGSISGTDKEMTASFLAILEHEVRVSNNIKNTSLGIENLMNHQLLDGFSNPVISREFADVINRDVSLLVIDRNKLDDFGIYVFLFLVNGYYSGHVYSWKIKNYTNVIGIRYSLREYLSGSRKGMSFLLLKEIENWSRGNIIRVLRPIGRMPENLNKMGYSLISKQQMDDKTITEMDYFPIIIGIRYIFYNPKIENDYIKVNC